MHSEEFTAVRLENGDAKRADIYVLLGCLLAAPPTADVLAAVTGLKGDDSELGSAITTLGAALRAGSAETIGDEFQRLFVGIDMDNVPLPYASLHVTGYLFGRSLVRLREDMDRLGIARAADVKEPEDHFSALCEMMAGLILGWFGAGVASHDVQRGFFEVHMAPWAAKFLADMEVVDNADFYAAVGRMGRVFLQGECRLFGLSSRIQ